MKSLLERILANPRGLRLITIAAVALFVLGAVLIAVTVIQPAMVTTWAVPDHPSVMTITVALANEPDTLFPLAAAMPEARLVLAAVYEPPIFVQHYLYRPGILQSLPSVENRQAVMLGQPPKGDVGTDTRQISLTFALRSDLRWSDGQPVTSDDLAWSYQLARDASTDVAFPAPPVDIAKVQPVDPNALSVMLGAGLVSPQYFTYIYPPLPRHKLENQAPDTLAFGENSRRPVGYGPYEVVDWTPGEHIVLQRNNYYYRRPEGVPRVPYLVFDFVPDAAARLKAVEEGRADVAVGLGYDMLGRILDAEKAGRVQAQYVPGQTWEMIAFNLDDPILKDLVVRQAIALATNRERMVTDLMHNKVQVMNSWLPPDHPDYAGDSALTRYVYDPVQAGNLLDAAGWIMSGTVRFKGTQPLRLTIRATKDDALRQAYLKQMQADLKAVGIDLAVELLSRLDWYGAKGKLTQRDFQLGVLPWVAAPDPGGAELWTATAIPTTTNGFRGQNYAGWNNPQNEDYYRQLADTLRLVERHALFVKQQVLVSQDLPVLPLFQHVVMVAANPKLTGLQLDPTNLLTQNVAEWDIPK